MGQALVRTCSAATYNGLTFNPGVMVCSISGYAISWSAIDILRERHDWETAYVRDTDFPPTHGEKVFLRHFDHDELGRLTFALPYDKITSNWIRIYYDQSGYRRRDPESPDWFRCHGFEHE
ncbi:hypothetical protein PYCC9005_004928 [Savitreella phatthalungensis]